MGNIFAIRPGQNNEIAPIGLGSHLDTQPTGGRFDGILGVHCALEVLRVLDESRIATYAPLAVINWTNEEGARFPPAMLGSGVWAEQYTLEYAQTRPSVEGVTMGEEIKRIGYLGKAPCSHQTNPLSAHFEVHIEQGTLLEKANQAVGLVKGSQSVCWLRAIFRGRSQHTGGTPMDKRSDPVIAAAQAILEVNRIANERGFRLTTSIVKSEPRSANTIAGSVELLLDLRTPFDTEMESLHGIVKQSFEAIRLKTKTQLEFERVWNSPAEAFDTSMVDCVRQSIKEIGCDVETTSYIGHDSVFTSKVVPTAMIFTRCKDGISHSPDEYTSPEE
ncbi:hypothetical protein LTR46_011070 [Exophiala xenobiotica]|nr:hypothetical protein LTR46_011070 [Exophiala xenobiotica]